MPRVGRAPRRRRPARVGVADRDEERRCDSQVVDDRLTGKWPGWPAVPGPDGPEGGGPDGSSKAMRVVRRRRPGPTRPRDRPAGADGDGLVGPTLGLELGLVVADVSPVPVGVGEEVWLAQPTTTGDREQAVPAAYDHGLMAAPAHAAAATMTVVWMMT